MFNSSVCICQSPIPISNPTIDDRIVVPMLATIILVSYRLLYPMVKQIFQQNDNKAVKLIHNLYASNIVSNTASILSPMKYGYEKLNGVNPTASVILAAMYLTRETIKFTFPVYKDILKLHARVNKLLDVAGRAEKIICKTWSDLVAFKVLYETLLFLVIQEKIFFIIVALYVGYNIGKDNSALIASIPHKE